MFLEDVLEDFGHQMLGPYSRVDAALAAVGTEDFDVAILDVNVNGQAIFPVADAIAARGIPFIFSTGYGQKSLPEKYRSRPTLDKPRSEERRVGKECVSTCRSRWSPSH